MKTAAEYPVIVIGGGAAGYFGAITCAEKIGPGKVLLLEATHQPLDKVRISGGGRCNVTHHCYDPAQLVAGYPRGFRELRGPFSRFQPRDTVAWFEARGVPLKVEPDGRMFPVSDNSGSVVDCLVGSAERSGVVSRRGIRVTDLSSLPGSRTPRFAVETASGERATSERVLLATGNAAIGHEMAARLGHKIEPCVPSLFTFKIDDPRLAGMAGISVPDAVVKMEIDHRGFEQRGPLLITHWGLSGPAVLKLSAWGARELAASHYRAKLTIGWNAATTRESLRAQLTVMKSEAGKREVHSSGIEPIPRRLWASLMQKIGIPEHLTWANVTRAQTDEITNECCAGQYQIQGKGAFKEEFVTCGGVKLAEVDFRTMESAICPGLYFAGEILDIDGITGGYNFQSAWTTGWIAGQSMAETI